MSISLNTVAGVVRLLPLRAAQFMKGDGTYLKCYHIEEESSFDLIEKNISHYQSGEICLGHTVEASLVIPHNYFDENPGLVDLLESFKGTRPDTHLFFGKSVPFFSAPLEIPPHVINATDGFEVHLEKICTFSYEIRYVHLRPRLTIKLKGFVEDLTKVPFEPGSETTFRMFDKQYPIFP